MKVEQIVKKYKPLFQDTFKMDANHRVLYDRFLLDNLQKKIVNKKFSQLTCYSKDSITMFKCTYEKS